MLKIRFLKYTFIGGIATLLDWGIFFLLSYLIGLNYIFSVFVAVSFAASVKFFLNKFITFKDRSKKYFRQIGVFALVNILAIFLNILFMIFFVEIFFLEKMSSKIITTFIVVILNYNLDRKWTYRIRY